MAEIAVGLLARYGGSEPGPRQDALADLLESLTT